MEFRMCCQSLLVLSCVVIAYGDNYNGLSKMWSNKQSRTVDVLSEPESGTKDQADRFAVNPQVIPVKPEQIRHFYYSRDNKQPIQEAAVRHMSDYDDVEHVTRGAFQPSPISLAGANEQSRSFNDGVSPTMAASRRSLSYILGVEDEEGEEEGGDGEYEEDEEESADNVKEKHYKHKLKPKKPKKLGKYMLPLLLAYKMKYFAMVPVMIGGLVLLVGATGLAGFFFALFAAVMGLQKGSY